MHKGVSHGLDLLISVISTMCSLVSTRVCVILVSSSAKPHSRITGRAVILIIANKTDSCFGGVDTTLNPSLLQLGFNEACYPISVFHVSRPGGVACTVLPVSDQRVQRVGLLVNDDKLDLLADLHTEEDLGEGCVPVDR